jgi:hypothetical protein
MGLFSKKSKDTPEGGLSDDEILGFLDDLFAQRVMIDIRSGSRNWQCSIFEVDEKRRVMRISGSSDIINYEGKQAHCGFSLDHTWYEFNTTIAAANDKPYLYIPGDIVRNERRKHPRTHMTSRENVTASVLEGFGQGKGVMGNVLDISTGGVGMEIVRVMILENEKEIVPNESIFEHGQKLMLVRVKGLSGLPQLEMEGVVNRVVRLSGRLRLIVEYPNLKSQYKNALQGFIAPRQSDYHPIVRSRKKRLEMEEKRNQDLAREKVTDPVEDKLVPEPVKAETIPEPVPAAKVKSLLAQDDSLNQNLIGNRRILSFGDMILDQVGFLKTEPGFDWIHAENPLQVIKSLRELKPDFLLVNLNFNDMNVIEYLEKLAHMKMLDGIRIVLLCETKVTPANMVKCKMLGIRDMFPLPLESQDLVRACLKVE